MMNEGSDGFCGKASEYIAELGYYAQKSRKYVKIFVLSELNADRSIRRIRTAVQEELESEPVCP